jgi:hypothetical protein
MKDQTNEEPLDPLLGKLPVTAGRPGTASAQHVEKQGAGPVDPDALCGGIRRRVRLSHWKQGKRPRARRRNLIKLGIALSEVDRARRSGKGYWRMSQKSLVRFALKNAYLKEQGVPELRDIWIWLHYGDEPKSTGKSKLVT